MKINITAGDCLNKILINKYPNEYFIPFNEAMIIGDYNSPFFSKEFIVERAKTHDVTIDEYKDKLYEFLKFLKNINQYNEVVLWFGDEPFCTENMKVVLETLKTHNYNGRILINIVVEETGEIKQK